MDSDVDSDPNSSSDRSEARLAGQLAGVEDSSDESAEPSDAEAESESDSEKSSSGIELNSENEMDWDTRHIWYRAWWFGTFHRCVHSSNHLQKTHRTNVLRLGEPLHPP